MTVYVDDMNIRADVPDGAKVVHGRWSHLFADTEDELRAFATRIGLKPAWIQHPGQHHVHFDVTGRIRQRAIAAGAQPVTWRQAGEFFAARARNALIPVGKPVTSLLLVSGPRDGVSKQTVRAALAPKFAPAVMLVTGAAQGVDTYAAELWREWGGLVEEHPVTTAEWDHDPRGAGFARNARMVERVKAAGGSVLVIDLPCARPRCPRPQPHNTHGTSHCARIAEKAGLEVEHYPAPPADDPRPPAGSTPQPPLTGPNGEDGASGKTHGRAVRQAAYLYLGHGLLPVPGWGAAANGACRCPRGVACPRPGKHPRSVHVGPGERDYSWKPLACHTHDEVDQRFADGGPYAAGNLMLAIPPGMLGIDQDDDDGGPQAIAALTGQLGELPVTLTHRTPHGVHRVYRTPPGWAGRAWVGKDTRNPLPAGIDLRVPGQILMAAPSKVPAEGKLAAYGPVAATAVAGLPAAYLAAWTPPQPETVRRRAVPVPPDRADTAASYVHARVEGIAADLADHEPGGRGTAIYTAALKVGSTLGAARTTPGAGHAAAEWTDQAAEDKLMEAAEANGYVAKHGAAAARTAIRSGLRNGLRSPRPLPDFTASHAAQPGTARTHPRPDRAARQAGQAQAAGTTAAPATGVSPGTGQDGPAQTQQESSDAAAETVSAVLAAAGYPVSTHRQGTGWGEGFRVHPQPGGTVVIGHEAVAETIGGVTPWDRVHQMTGRYARTLRDAGYQVTSPAPGSLTATPQPGDRQARAAVSPARAREATQAAVTADEAYRAQDLDRARRFVNLAAELDPGRAGLWDQQRAEITAKQLFTQATVAKAAGDHAQAEDLLARCRELDPRLDARWHRHLTGIRNGQATSQPVKAAEGRAAGRSQRPAPPKAQKAAKSRETGPQWPTTPTRSSSPQATDGQAGTHPEKADHGDQTTPGTAKRGQQRPRHSWQPVGEGTKRCTRDGCGLEATRRPHPTERRWLTSYTKNGRTIIAARVPGCGQDLPHGASTEQMQDLATEADRQAGQAFRTGDIDRAFRLLTDARALDPQRHQLWDQHETQIRHAVASEQPRQVSHSTETAPCPQCGHSYLRPVGETHPCLPCQTQTRLKAAGYTPSSPESQQIAEWNRAVLRRGDRQQETPQPNPPEPDTQTTAQPGEKESPEHEKEACG